jgi:hypothetical protein
LDALPAVWFFLTSLNPQEAVMKKKNLFQRMAMPLPELEKYYEDRRLERFERNHLFGGAMLRRLLHPVFLLGLKLQNLATGQTVTVLGDDRIPTDTPLIFASTHCGWEDPPVVFRAVRDHAYLFWGDPKSDYKTSDGFFMDVNGIIVCHTNNKTDRYIGKETCIRWLERGGNLLIYPEGAWNVTAHLPVMALYHGVAEMAIRTGAQIVPVAFERYGKHSIVKIGANISPDSFSLERKEALTQILRDSLAALKWEVWSSQPQESRDTLPEDYLSQYLRSFTDQIPDDSYSLEIIEKTRFHTKAEREHREAFAHLEHLIPRRENAFLFHNLQERNV